MNERPEKLRFFSRPVLLAIIVVALLGAAVASVAGDGLSAFFSR